MSLEAITILDLTHMLSGPYGTLLLADLGARTIKIEPPGSGEITRRILETDPMHSRDGMGAYFLSVNRRKESVAINLKDPLGLQLFLDLVRHADVVFDNFSAGVTKRLGIDHAALSRVNPRIVTCSVTGFGETGPDKDRPAFDQVIQALSGGMSITGHAETPPVRSGVPIGDVGGGMFGAIGVLAALVQRQFTGTGQHVDVSMLDAQISMLNFMATMYFMSGDIPERVGNGHPVHVPYNIFATSDGQIVIACIGDEFYDRFLNVVGHERLHSPEFRTQAGRLAARAEIEAIISAELCRNSSRYWTTRLRSAQVPCGAVNDFGQALADPQVLARRMVIDVPLVNGEHVRMPGNPIKLPGSDDIPLKAPPRLGQHTKAVLREFLGIDEARLREMEAIGVVGMAANES